MKKFLLATILLTLPGALAASAGWDQTRIKSKTKVVAPSEAMVEVRADSSGRLFAVVADWRGGPLPAYQTITVAFTPAETGRVHTSNFQGRLYFPYQTKPEWVESLGRIPPQTQYALWREESGEWGAMVSLAGGGLRCWLYGEDGKVLAVADSMADDFAPRRVPMFALGWGDDPFKLTRDLYVFAFEAMRAEDPDGIIGRLRREKEYPNAFRYIGWCSWNAYYRKISEEKLVRHAKHYRDSGFPLRFILIDDCWMKVNKHVLDSGYQEGLYLTGLDADPEAFPGGLARTVRVMKEDYGVSYVGVWNTFNGYWRGIELGSAAAVAGSIMPISDQAGVPDPRSDAGFRFWDAWYKNMTDAGVDFVKTDNQGTFGGFLNGALPISHAMARAQDNMQRATEKYFGANVLNTMEMNVHVIYQWRSTNLGRASTDYVPISYNNPRTNTVTNVYNSLWFENVSYPDYDMFQSHDGHVYYYTTARALSGGPLYISDALGREEWDELWPTIYQDGEIIRADDPGLPARQVLLEAPYTSGKPLIMFARTGPGGALGLWNSNKFYLPVKAEIGPADVEGMSGERFVMYEHFTGEVRVVSADDRFPVRLSPWGARVYALWPIESGFAPVGLIDKYLSGGAVAGVTRSADSVTVSLKDAGKFAAWTERPPKSAWWAPAGGAKLELQFQAEPSGLIVVELPKTEGRRPGDLTFIFPGS